MESAYRGYTSKAKGDDEFSAMDVSTEGASAGDMAAICRRGYERASRSVPKEGAAM